MRRGDLMDGPSTSFRDTEELEVNRVITGLRNLTPEEWSGGRMSKPPAFCGKEPGLGSPTMSSGLAGQF